MIVCARRRALPAGPGGERQIGAGFIIVLDSLGITPAIIRGESKEKPLNEWSMFKLAAFLPEIPVEEAARLTTEASHARLIDQAFPLHSQWSLTLLQHDGVAWVASGKLKRLCPPVRLRCRDEADEEKPLEEPATPQEGGGDFTLLRHLPAICRSRFTKIH